MNEIAALYCANIRNGPQFTVASASRHEDDVDETDAERMLASFQEGYSRSEPINSH